MYKSLHSEWIVANPWAIIFQSKSLQDHYLRRSPRMSTQSQPTILSIPHVGIHTPLLINRNENKLLVGEYCVQFKSNENSRVDQIPWLIAHQPTSHVSHLAKWFLSMSPTQSRRRNLHHPHQCRTSARIRTEFRSNTNMWCVLLKRINSTCHGGSSFISGALPFDTPNGTVPMQIQSQLGDCHTVAVCYSDIHIIVVSICTFDLNLSFLYWGFRLYKFELPSVFNTNNYESEPLLI